MRSVLFFARDPGPANHVVSAWQLCDAPGENLLPGAAAFRSAASQFLGQRIALARGPAVGVFERAGIRSERPEFSDIAECMSFLERRKIGMVVTGTSDIDEKLDRVLWKAARASGISSHAFLDCPANLDVRFRDSDGSQTMPDFLYVPDAGYNAVLEQFGIDVDLRITGALYETRLLRQRDGALAARATLRRQWRSTEADRVVLFASECGREMALQGRPSPYDEMEILEAFARELGADEASVLVVRPHPRDTVGKYDPWLADAPPGLRCLVSDAGTSAEAILAADVVVGMNSTMLREARALGCPHRSLIDADLTL